MRPEVASWFELLTPRQEITAALECLAATEAVELQTHSQVEAALVLPALEAALEDYAEQRRVYGPWWPEPDIPSIGEAAEPAQLLDEARARIAAWERDAAAPVAAIQSLTAQMESCRDLRDALEGQTADLPNLAALVGAGPVLASRLYRIPAGEVPETLPPTAIVEWFRNDSGTYLLAAGPAEEIAQLDVLMKAMKARRIALPAWLPEDQDGIIAAIDAKSEQLETESAACRTELERLAESSGLARALGDMVLLEWFASHAPRLPVTDHFAWITGWTSDKDGADLDRALDDAGVDHLLRYSDSPPGAVSPVILRNPLWARAFELFPRLLGTPGTTEADPTRILAAIAPVMFGFMFGDVGHGAVLLIAGLVLRRQWPVMGLLVPGGIMSMVFGVAFGSVFCREDIIPALWLHPLAEPLTLLVTSLVFGVVVVSLGLFLDATQALWRGLGRQWLATRAGIVLAYAGLILSVLEPDALWLVVAGMTWYLAGSVATSGVRQVGAAVGHLAETSLQLVVNTVSFVRVGAFALAHAGLSAAVVGLADALGSVPAMLAVMVLGNALVIVLEGLVVGIQTTRLVLFEFFIRFLTAEGRPFRPLLAPSALLNLKRGKHP